MSGLVNHYPARPNPGATRRPVASWMAALLACAGAVAVALAGAPGRMDHGRVDVSGPDAAAAIAALAAALASPESTTVPIVVIDSDSVAIDVARTAGAPGLRQRAAAAIHRALRDIGPVAAPAPAALVQPAQAAERPALTAELAATDRRSDALSDSLTDLARAIATLEQSRPSPPAQTMALDQARASLVQAELRRVDLASRYTDSFPAIAVADAQIAQLRAVVATQSGPTRPDPTRKAVATLQEEQSRLKQEWLLVSARHDPLAARLLALNHEPAAVPAPAPIQLVAFRIEELGTTALPDRRPLWLGAIAAVALAAGVAAWPRAVRMTQIAAIERATGLPVLRCLDVSGRALAMERPSSVPAKYQLDKPIQESRYMQPPFIQNNAGNRPARL